MSLKTPKYEHDTGNVYLPVLSSMIVTLQTAADETRCVLRVQSNSAVARKLGKTFRNKMSVKCNEVQHHLAGPILFGSKNTTLSISK